MKKIKKWVSVLTLAALLVLVPGVGSVTAHAAEPVTYSVKFIGGDINDWRYQVGSTYVDGEYSRELYCMLLDIKDGDYVVVYPSDPQPDKSLDLSGVKLGNLTISSAHVVVYTGGVQDCYVLANSYCAINGDVTNAYLYDNTTCTFNNNVLDMTLYSSDMPVSNLSCAGTVGHFNAFSSNMDKKVFEFFNIAEGAFILQNGTSQVPYDKYSPEPTSDYLQAMETASAPAESAESAPADTNAPADTSAPAAPSAGSSDEYDSVPKTGDSSVYIWLLCASAACFTGCRILRKKAS